MLVRATKVEKTKRHKNKPSNTQPTATTNKRTKVKKSPIKTEEDYRRELAEKQKVQKLIAKEKEAARNKAIEGYSYKTPIYKAPLEHLKHQEKKIKKIDFKMEDLIKEDMLYGTRLMMYLKYHGNKMSTEDFFVHLKDFRDKAHEAGNFMLHSVIKVAVNIMGIGSSDSICNTEIEAVTEINSFIKMKEAEYKKMFEQEIVYRHVRDSNLDGILALLNQNKSKKEQKFVKKAIESVLMAAHISDIKALELKIQEGEFDKHKFYILSICEEALDAAEESIKDAIEKTYKPESKQFDLDALDKLFSDDKYDKGFNLSILEEFLRENELSLESFNNQALKENAPNLLEAINSMYVEYFSERLRDEQYEEVEKFIGTFEPNIDIIKIVLTDIDPATLYVALNKVEENNAPLLAELIAEEKKVRQDEIEECFNIEGEGPNLAFLENMLSKDYSCFWIIREVLADLSKDSIKILIEEAKYKTNLLYLLNQFIEEKPASAQLLEEQEDSKVADFSQDLIGDASNGNDQKRSNTKSIDSVCVSEIDINQPQSLLKQDVPIAGQVAVDSISAESGQ